MYLLPKNYQHWWGGFYHLGVLIVLVTATLGGANHHPISFVPTAIVKPTHFVNSTFHADSQLPQSVAQIVQRANESNRYPVAKIWADSMSFKRATITGWNQSSQSPQTSTLPSNTTAANNPPPNDNQRFQWRPALIQATRFLVIEHAFRFATEAGTREEMKGPFFRDWFDSVRRTRGWRDGDPFIVNYVGHPMQGSVTNYIYLHNDPKSVLLEAGWNKAYFKSRLKAMLFSTVYSTQFELGPIGEASLGNVGLRPTKTSQHPSAFVDLVITPTLGTVWTMGEDALDRLVVRKVEDHVANRFVRLMVRGFLTPSRSFANVLRGRYPWHRDGRRL